MKDELTRMLNEAGVTAAQKLCKNGKKKHKEHLGKPV
jgi:hypothetical protein